MPRYSLSFLSLLFFPLYPRSYVIRESLSVLAYFIHTWSALQSVSFFPLFLFFFLSSRRSLACQTKKNDLRSRWNGEHYFSLNCDLDPLCPVVDSIPKMESCDCVWICAWITLDLEFLFVMLLLPI